MNPTPPPSENLFLRNYGALRQQSVKLTGKLLMLSVLPLALLMLWMGVLALGDLRETTARQADAVGNALASQIAASVAEPLSAGDKLSLNIMLAQWQQNPLVAHTRVFTAENRMIAEAGDRISAARMAPGQGQFSAAVLIQDTLAGQVQLSLSPEPFMAPVNGILRQLAWAFLLAALGVSFVAYRMAGNMRRVMQQLGEWQADSPAPGQQRRDELGDLARQLGTRYQDPAQLTVTVPSPHNTIAELSATEQKKPADAELADHESGAEQKLDPDTAPSLNPLDPGLSAELGAHLQTLENTVQAGPADAQEESDSSAGSDSGQDDPTDTTTTPTLTIGTQEVAEEVAHAQETTPAPPALLETTVLAIRLGNQEALRRLPRARLMALLGRYREQLDRACELYSGHIQTLHDGTSLVVFNARECRQDELTHALCCGELLRVLGHDLQVEIADTGITLHLHLALCHATCLRNVPADELAEQPACQTLIEQVQYSRNLLLLDSSLANCDMLRQRAVVRRLASQPGIYCIERLQDPYQAMLEQQLNHFYQQRQS